MISIKGLNKARVLLSLYNNSKAQEMLGLPKGVITEKDCVEALEEQTYFDYWKGKVMKVDLAGDSFNPSAYDRDNGYGAAQKAVDLVRLIDGVTE